MIKRYTFTLEKEVVEKAKKLVKTSGRKLSPVINLLLKKWIIKNKNIHQ